MCEGEGASEREEQVKDGDECVVEEEMQAEPGLAADGRDEAGQGVVAHERVHARAEQRGHARHVERRRVALRPAAHQQVDRH